MTCTEMILIVYTKRIKYLTTNPKITSNRIRIKISISTTIPILSMKVLEWLKIPISLLVLEILTILWYLRTLKFTATNYSKLFRIRWKNCQSEAELELSSLLLIKFKPSSTIWSIFDPRSSDELMNWF